MLAELIPMTFFEGFATDQEYVLWLMAVGAIALLVVGADKAVAAAAKLAAAAGMSKIIIGATVVSLGTTSPEACVSVMAAWRGDPGLALGNGMGSIICDTALIFGLCCCIRRLPMDRFILNRQGWLQFGAGALLAAVIVGSWLLAGRSFDGAIIPRWVGIIFLLLLVGYMCLSVRWARTHEGMVALEAVDDVTAASARNGRSIVFHLLFLFAGLALVVFGSEVLIGSAKTVCEKHGVPETVIAGTFVAFGTSLPELVTAIASLVKGHAELLLGNVVGADILNVLFVIGASASARPLQVDEATLYLLVPTMLLALALLRGYILMNRNTFKRWQGVPLLICYVVFVLLSVLKFGIGV
ncbi:MAG: sodium:calcium antiporter [Phycisphaerae bacterium]|jgi:cation:H+ antiporter|nr:sodium:calcium antiporter [Phycisphaerae bacterium]